MQSARFYCEFPPCGAHPASPVTGLPGPRTELPPIRSARHPGRTSSAARFADETARVLPDVDRYASGCRAPHRHQATRRGRLGGVRGRPKTDAGTCTIVLDFRHGRDPAATPRLAGQGAPGLGERLGGDRTRLHAGERQTAPSRQCHPPLHRAVRGDRPPVDPAPPAQRRGDPHPRGRSRAEGHPGDARPLLDHRHGRHVYKPAARDGSRHCRGGGATRAACMHATGCRRTNRSACGWRGIRRRTAHANGPGRGVRGRVEPLPGEKSQVRAVMRCAPGRIRTCDTRFRSSIYARPWSRRRLVRRSPGCAAVCRRLASLMSALDVTGTASELGRPPTDRPAGPPTATTCASPRTATTPGRSVGRRRPARRAPGRPTSGAGCTRDRAEHRRPYGEP